MIDIAFTFSLLLSWKKYLNDEKQNVMAKTYRAEASLEKSQNYFKQLTIDAQNYYVEPNLVTLHNRRGVIVGASGYR